MTQVPVQVQVRLLPVPMPRAEELVESEPDFIDLTSSSDDESDVELMGYRDLRRYKQREEHTLSTNIEVRGTEKELEVFTAPLNVHHVPEGTADATPDADAVSVSDSGSSSNDSDSDLSRDNIEDLIEKINELNEDTQQAVAAATATATDGERQGENERETDDSMHELDQLFEGKVRSLVVNEADMLPVERALTQRTPNARKESEPEKEKDHAKVHNDEAEPTDEQVKQVEQLESNTTESQMPQENGTFISGIYKKVRNLFAKGDDQSQSQREDRNEQQRLSDEKVADEQQESSGDRNIPSITQWKLPHQPASSQISSSGINSSQPDLDSSHVLPNNIPFHLQKSQVESQLLASDSTISNTSTQQNLQWNTQPEVNSPPQAHSRTQSQVGLRTQSISDVQTESHIHGIFTQDEAPQQPNPQEPQTQSQTQQALRTSSNLHSQSISEVMVDNSTHSVIQTQPSQPPSKTKIPHPEKLSPETLHAIPISSRKDLSGRTPLPMIHSRQSPKLPSGIADTSSQELKSMTPIPRLREPGPILFVKPHIFGKTPIPTPLGRRNPLAGLENANMNPTFSHDTSAKTPLAQTKMTPIPQGDFIGKKPIYTLKVGNIPRKAFEGSLNKGITVVKLTPAAARPFKTLSSPINDEAIPEITHPEEDDVLESNSALAETQVLPSQFEAQEIAYQSNDNVNQLPDLIDIDYDEDTDDGPEVLLEQSSQKQEKKPPVSDETPLSPPPPPPPPHPHPHPHPHPQRHHSLTELPSSKFSQTMLPIPLHSNQNLHPQNNQDVFSSRHRQSTDLYHKRSHQNPLVMARKLRRNKRPTRIEAVEEAPPKQRARRGRPRKEDGRANKGETENEQQYADSRDEGILLVGEQSSPEAQVPQTLENIHIDDRDVVDIDIGDAVGDLGIQGEPDTSVTSELERSSKTIRVRKNLNQSESEDVSEADSESEDHHNDDVNVSYLFEDNGLDRNNSRSNSETKTTDIDRRKSASGLRNFSIDKITKASKNRVFNNENINLNSVLGVGGGGLFDDEGDSENGSSDDGLFSKRHRSQDALISENSAVLFNDRSVAKRVDFQIPTTTNKTRERAAEPPKNILADGKSKNSGRGNEDVDDDVNGLTDRGTEEGYKKDSSYAGITETDTQGVFEEMIDHLELLDESSEGGMPANGGNDELFESEVVTSEGAHAAVDAGQYTQSHPQGGGLFVSDDDESEELADDEDERTGALLGKLTQQSAIEKDPVKKKHIANKLARLAERKRAQKINEYTPFSESSSENDDDNDDGEQGGSAVEDSEQFIVGDDSVIYDSDANEDPLNVDLESRHRRKMKKVRGSSKAKRPRVLDSEEEEEEQHGNGEGIRRRKKSHREKSKLLDELEFSNPGKYFEDENKVIVKTIVEEVGKLPPERFSGGDVKIIEDDEEEEDDMPELDDVEEESPPEVIELLSDDDDDDDREVVDLDDEDNDNDDEIITRSPRKRSEGKSKSPKSLFLSDSE
jgi:hypothetical protein